MELPADNAPAPAVEPVVGLVNRITRKARNRTETDGTLKARAKHQMVYYSFEADLAIKRFALEAGIKPHDFIVAALQKALDEHGINVRVRVPSRDRDETD